MSKKDRRLPPTPETALDLQFEWDAWRDREGLNPTRAQRARFARCIRAAARWGIAYVPWAEEQAR